MSDHATRGVPGKRGGRIGPPRPLRSVCLVAAAVLVATVGAGTSAADGDPASDLLLTQNVYVPYEAPSKAAIAALDRAAGAVYARGERVKVALIYRVDDLGAIPSMFGSPGDYAQFLGVELGNWYVGPLLVVMPAGFALYDGGRSTAAADQVLRSVQVSTANPDEFARSAATAVQRLAAAGALSSPDVKAPLVTAHPASATRGRPATLRFDLFDDSGRASATVRVYEHGALVATLRSPSGFEIGTRRARVRWVVPRRLRSRQLRFCVVASDPAGNRSAPACAPFLRVG